MEKNKNLEPHNGGNQLKAEIYINDHTATRWMSSSESRTKDDGTCLSKETQTRLYVKILLYWQENEREAKNTY